MSDLERTVNFIMSLSAKPADAKSLRFFQLKGRNQPFFIRIPNSGPLRIEPVTPEADGHVGMFSARVQFAERFLFTTELSVILAWCTEQFGNAYRSVGLEFRFQNENDLLAFKLRWAGVNAKDITA